MKWASVFFYIFFLFPALVQAKVPELRVESTETPSLSLIELSVDITIRGHLSRTEFVLTYKNDEKRDLRGDFLFPLPDDAILTDIGLYFGEKLRRSVIVERTHGRKAFEEIVHRRVDPALAEWMSGNTFRLDVYPVPARNIKKVFVSYQQELTQENGSWKYFLDLNYKRRLNQFHLKIDADAESVVHSGLSVSRTDGTWSFDQQDYFLETPLQIASTGSTANIALVEPAEEEGLYYVSLPVKAQSNFPKIEKASEVIVFWDNSGSSVNQNAKELFAFLHSFLKEQKQGVNVRLIPFHQELSSAVSIADADSEAGFTQLTQSLATLPPVGATDLVRVFESIGSAVQTTAVDSRIVIVTDGLDSLHSTTDLAKAIYDLAPLEKPMLVLTAADEINSQLLNQIAVKTGGWFVNLKGSKKPLAKLVKTVMHASATVTIYSNSSNFTDMTPNTHHLSDATLLRFAARSRNVVGEGILTLKVSGLYKERYQQVQFNYRMLHDCRGIVRTTWAASRLRDLMQMPGNHDQEYLEFGKKYHLLTPRTSLIVLETWQDYQRYGIPMPPDMQQEYQRQINPPVKRNRTLGGGQGTLFGRITDDKGAALPGVSLRLQSDQGLQRESTTGPSGAFNFAQIPPGNYNLTASLEGFTEVRQEEIRLSAAGSVQLTLTLRPTLEEEFVVVADTPMVDTRKTGNSTTFTREQYDGRPSGRDPWTHVEQTPGEQNDRINVSGSESGQKSEFFARGGNSYYDFDAFEQIAKRASPVDRAFMDQIFGDLSKAGLSEQEKMKLYVAGRTLFQNFPEYYIRAFQVFEGPIRLRILFDAIEFGNSDPGMMRTIARRVMNMGNHDVAKIMMLKIAEMAPNEPQSWRDLGLLYAKMGERTLAEEAYKKLLSGSMDPRHRAIVPLATEEFNRLLNAPVTAEAIDLEIDPEWDLKIILEWDSNYTDVDLHVEEPSGEEVSYDHPQSAAGGHLSSDVTSGYGPEIYTIRYAPSGHYRIFVNYYAADQASGMQSATAVVSIFWKNGKGRIVRSDHPIVLTKGGENVPVASVRVR